MDYSFLSGLGTFFVGAGALVVGVVTLLVAALALRNARRSAELAEERVQYLTDERDRLAFLREKHRTLQEGLEQERQKRLEAEQRAERVEQGRPPAQLQRELELLKEELEREQERCQWEREQRLEAQRQAEKLEQEDVQLRQQYRQVAEQLEQERTEHLKTQHLVRQEQSEKEQQRQARQYAERRADYLEREASKLRETQHDGPHLDRERIVEDLREASKALWERLVPPK